MSKRKVLVPYFYNYYLFEYLDILTKELEARGYEVHVVTADEVVYDRFKGLAIHSEYAPLVIRLLLRRSGNMLVRSLLWLSGYVWLFSIRNRYDFSILPWDNKPLWYLMSKNIPSLTVHNTTNLMDLDFEIDTYKSGKRHLVAQFIEKVLKIRLLPILCQTVLKHNRFWYLDRLFGMRSDNLVQGFSGLDYISVTGNKIKDTLEEAGLPSKGTQIFVTGNPAYDGFIGYAERFSNSQKKILKRRFNLPEYEDLYALFLSPSSFNNDQIEEVMLVVGAILDYNKTASILVKFHPKTLEKYVAIFRDLISRKTENYSIVEGYTGDHVNLDIILSSKCILQKQSTVGYVSMLVSRPIISYNLMDTNYSDDMYKVMKSSLHCENISDVLESLYQLDDEDVVCELKELQKIACENYCKRTNSASSEIVDIIDTHFQAR